MGPERGVKRGCRAGKFWGEVLDLLGVRGTGRATRKRLSLLPGARRAASGSGAWGKRLARLGGAIALLGLVAACGLIEGDKRANQPLSKTIVSKLDAMGSSQGAAMIIRLFKEENTVEVWKQVAGGRFELFKSYEICAWSGELGPKFKEGDRQSPEGFYSVTPGLMNPKSSYYLSFNTGFPNKFDRAWGRTGSDLMIHGDCSSRGCYAMTDEQIAEIYALGREAFRGGQRQFSLQLYPFRMTVQNMVKHRDSPHIEFWWNIKQGYDAFEISRRDVKWDVCQKRYVFYPAGGPLNAAGACPAGSSDPDLMFKVAARQKADLSAFKIAAAQADKKDAVKLAKADEAAAQRQRTEEVLAARSAALSGAVEQSTSAVSGAFGGLFDSIFGAARPANSGAASGPAPYPAPRPANRG